MSEEGAVRRATARGRRAQAILEDELVVEAFTAIERRAHQAWAHSLPADSEARDLAYRDLRALRAFRAELEAFIRDGKVAEREL